MKKKITAAMKDDKYIELAPGYPYEVVEYRAGKIMLKGCPRKYPAEHFQLKRGSEEISVKKLQWTCVMDTVWAMLRIILVLVSVSPLFGIVLILWLVGYALSNTIQGWLCMAGAVLVLAGIGLIIEKLA